jgi:hypothetical protein
VKSFRRNGSSFVVSFSDEKGGPGAERRLLEAVLIHKTPRQVKSPFDSWHSWFVALHSGDSITKRRES